MIITRDIINKNITYKDFNQTFPIREYNYEDLNNEINMFKNLLINKYNCQPGQKVLIGFHAGIMQTALIFAASELGLKIVVVDYNRNDQFKNNADIDPKTRLLMPIDYFFLDIKRTWTYKISLLDKLSKEKIFVLNHLIDIERSDLNDKNSYGIYKLESNGEFKLSCLPDYTPNTEIRADSDSVFMICTSSGTTGTPKIIEHTHKFIYSLSHRNKSMFYGNVGVNANLQHGSSFATYFLPSIVSDQVESIYSFISGGIHQYPALNLDHLMFPYTMGIEFFVESSTKKNSQLNLYTLNYIRSRWKSAIDDEKLKDIISIFGSNETSGPVFINKLSDSSFEETRYCKLDDFYDINLDEEGGLSVTLPIYENKTIYTNDKFKLNEDGSFSHLGRNDLIRINHLTVDTEIYKNKVAEFLNGELIYDSIQQQIYLAIWEEKDNLENIVKEIIDFILRYSGKVHNITKYKLLNYNDFLTGIKLDHELLRDYFRNQP